VSPENNQKDKVNRLIKDDNPPGDKWFTDEIKEATKKIRMEWHTSYDPKPGEETMIYTVRIPKTLITDLYLKAPPKDLGEVNELLQSAERISERLMALAAFTYKLEQRLKILDVTTRSTTDDA
jgi:hypothetical protein